MNNTLPLQVALGYKETQGADFSGGFSTGIPTDHRRTGSTETTIFIRDIRYVWSTLNKKNDFDYIFLFESWLVGESR